MPFKFTILSIAIYAILLSLLSACVTDSGVARFKHQLVADIDNSQIDEPSGICFHSQRGTLFVVGDEGDVYELETDGTMIKHRRFSLYDLEGITHNPATGLVYLAAEGDELIIEIDPETFDILREFPIPRVIDGDELLKVEGEGIEALTFAPNPNHPEGGTFFVGNQSFDLERKEDISGIFEVSLPLRQKGERLEQVKVLRYFKPGVVDVSGLFYDKLSDHLFIISDAKNRLFEFERSGKLIREMSFPGANQEGITVDNDGYMYIAQDTGGVIKVKWERTKE